MRTTSNDTARKFDDYSILIERLRLAPPADDEDCCKLRDALTDQIAQTVRQAIGTPCTDLSAILRKLEIVRDWFVCDDQPLAEALTQIGSDIGLLISSGTLPALAWSRQNSSTEQPVGAVDAVIGQE